MIRVKEIFDTKKKAYNVISPSDLVIDALTMLNSVNLSYLVVMEGESFRGIFSERDYCRKVILKGRSSKTTTVQEVMTMDLPMVEINDTVEHCMHLLDLYKTRYVLAFDDHGFAGVVTIHDLLRQVLSSREQVFDQSLADKLISHVEGDKVF